MIQCKLKSKELNFELILKSIRKSLSCWQWRNLTLIGKIQLVKTFAMPKFMYQASLISFDKDIIKSINSVIFNFVWRGKDKIKRLALISEYEDVWRTRKKSDPRWDLNPRPSVI